METFLRDLRYGARALARTPGFTAVAVLTLALGVGANAAIFSVARAVLLAPLPYTDFERTVAIWRAGRAGTRRGCRKPSCWITGRLAR
jgi:hypothetical protein